jgi:4-amino-4-deoxy-L-arabinose transferase-like glycosyltransferase
MSRKRYFLFITALIFSLFFNLGLPPLYHEEPRRALIALEMLYSGDYVVPSVLGMPYYAKPPLFNWALMSSYHFFGSFSEFAVRFPAVLSLLLTGLVHFFFVRRFMDERIAFYSAMLFITSGNIYFYFSLLGEIDLFFSLVIYLCLTSIFYFYQNGRLYLLFLSAFFLAALGFLTKGFPAVVFLYVSLFVFLASERQFKLLFSLHHLLGIIIFALISGTFFYFYQLRNPIDPYLRFLWSESAGRTVLANPLAAIPGHLIAFPLATLRAVLPYSLLLFFAFRKGFIKDVLAVPVLRFSLLIFAANYLVYLVSPGAKQRYIYMLYPFLTLLLCYAYLRIERAADTSPGKAITIIIQTALIVMAGAALALPFLKMASPVPHVPLISVFLFTFALAAALVSFRRKNAMLPLLLFTVIVVRLGFDAAFLPIRASKLSVAEVKENSQKIAAITRNGNLYLHGDDALTDAFGYIFYIERERGHILRRAQTLRRDDYFIAPEDSEESMRSEKLFSFRYKDAAYGLFKF